MDNQELSEILQQHRRWLLREDEGVRADLSGADLSDANLRGANLYNASLSFADLSGAKLNWVNWHEANGLLVYSAQLQSSRPNAQLTYIPSLDVATTGCWQDTWQATKDRVDEVYGGNDQRIHQAYQLAFDYIETQMKLDKSMEGK